MNVGRKAGSGVGGVGGQGWRIGPSDFGGTMLDEAAHLVVVRLHWQVMTQ